MNTYRERGKVAEGLNNRLDLGPKQKQSGPEKENPSHKRISLGGTFQANTQFEAPWKWKLFSRLLAGQDPINFALWAIQKRYWRLTARPSFFPGLPVLSSLAIVAVYVAGSGMLIPQEILLSLTHIQLMGNMPIWCKETPSVTFI